MIRHYLMLESNRFDGNFSYHLSVENEEKTKHVMIPSLLLQPYVENAILHGLLPSEKEKKELNINVSFHSDDTIIVIDDNGVGKENGESKKDNSHQSMGTKITQERINLFNKNYDGHISCKTVNKTGLNRFQTGTSVIIKLTNN